MEGQGHHCRRFWYFLRRPVRVIYFRFGLENGTTNPCGNYLYCYVGLIMSIISAIKKKKKKCERERERERILINIRETRLTVLVFSFRFYKKTVHYYKYALIGKSTLRYDLRLLNYKLFHLAVHPNQLLLIKSGIFFFFFRFARKTIKDFVDLLSIFPSKRAPAAHCRPIKLVTGNIKSSIYLFVCAFRKYVCAHSAATRK